MTYGALRTLDIAMLIQSCAEHCQYIVLLLQTAAMNCAVLAVASVVLSFASTGESQATFATGLKAEFYSYLIKTEISPAILSWTLIAALVSAYLLFTGLAAGVRTAHWHSSLCVKRYPMCQFAISAGKDDRYAIVTVSGTPNSGCEISHAKDHCNACCRLRSRCSRLGQKSVGFISASSITDARHTSWLDGDSGC